VEDAGAEREALEEGVEAIGRHGTKR